MTEPLRYDALTPDTQVSQSNDFRFDHGRLDLLKQFQESPIKTVISEIVLREVVDHLETKLKATKDGLAKALRDARDASLLADGDSGTVQRLGDYTVSAMTSDGRKPQTKRPVLCKSRARSIIIVSI
jgi:hypothetical protein